MDGIVSATANISPVTYEPLQSFKQTQLGKTRFALGKDNKGTGGLFQLAVKNEKGKLAPNQYDPKQIEKGFRMTTLGLSRGWK